MCPLLVLVLILQLSISFPAVAGDCYNELSNKKFNYSYDNCATCYQTLANALLNTGDNKYRLSKAFFPDDAVQPVVVKAVQTRNVIQPIVVTVNKILTTILLKIVHGTGWQERCTFISHWKSFYTVLSSSLHLGGGNSVLFSVSLSSAYQ